MNKYRLASLAILTLALNACSLVTGGGSDRANPQRYTLPTPKPAARATPSRHFPVVLQVAAINAPAWLSTPSMIYQLDYEKQGQLSAYTQSQWAAPPPAMLGQVLQNALAGGGAFKAVTGAGDVAADIVLQVELDDFSQRFTSPEKSHVLLDARATLVASGASHVLAQKNFHYRVAAASANAAGGVTALGKASSRFAAAIDRWTQQTLAQCAPGCLPSSAD